jgi:hypothetical protein
MKTQKGRLVVLILLAGTAAACAVESRSPPPTYARTAPPPPPAKSTTRTAKEGSVSTTQTTGAELLLQRRPPSTPMTHSIQPGANVQPEDRRISERISAAIVADRTLHDVALDRVQITTLGRKVILTGLVPTLADSVAIETHAREIRGVDIVENRLEILR